MVETKSDAVSINGMTFLIEVEYGNPIFGSRFKTKVNSVDNLADIKDKGVTIIIEHTYYDYHGNLGVSESKIQTVKKSVSFGGKGKWGGVGGNIITGTGLLAVITISSGGQEETRHMRLGSAANRTASPLNLGNPSQMPAFGSGISG